MLAWLLLSPSINFQKPFNGKVRLIQEILTCCGDFIHLCFHLCASSELNSCHCADMLIRRGTLVRNFSRFLFWLECPLAACYDSFHARSRPRPCIRSTPDRSPTFHR